MVPPTASDSSVDTSSRVEALFSGPPAVEIEPIDAARGSFLARAFAFPNPVNEFAARSTAGIVVVLSCMVLALGLATGAGWGLWVIAAGFWLRVAGGPRYSPVGRLAVHVIAPRLGKARLVAGPPKRFAQGIGAFVSTAAVVLYVLGLAPAAWAALAVLIVAASLEAFAGFCLGCWIFGRLQLAGLVPASVCEACSDIALRSKDRTAR
ncbi:DUF4395 domain-containing protein [Sinomonas sp. ASV486]|uniref:DUF4395 domain-containing protein n=1 Tax=Sinomonas sp. ASV486 TaxID=3051170 RepID=UPI0027DE6B45|nr:DUF4395 domain-containing protein [Sinomonas sp. ASV486]MDQ4490585.1 DUF4395 domain-containing protein [Sinomonas sp. ASV486]